MRVRRLSLRPGRCLLRSRSREGASPLSEAVSLTRTLAPDGAGGEPEGAALRFPSCTRPTARQDRLELHDPRRPRARCSPAAFGRMHTSSLLGLADGQEAAALLPAANRRRHTMTGTRIQATCSKTSKPANLAVQAQAPATQDSRADIYQRVTDRIAAAMEAGAGKWRTVSHTAASTPW